MTPCLHPTAALTPDRRRCLSCGKTVEEITGMSIEEWDALVNDTDMEEYPVKGTT